MRQTVLRVALAIVPALTLLLAPALAAAQGAGGQRIQGAHTANTWAPPNTVYIPETGHTIDGVFLDFWRANSGIATYGYPITAEIEENGHVVQYYEYTRFEYWPEDPDGTVVHLGAIGQELRPHLVLRTRPTLPVGGEQQEETSDVAIMSRAWLPLDADTAAQPNTDTWRYVPETRHSVQHGFKAHWEATGEASYLGNPLTEEYVLTGVTYQTFERGQLAWTKKKDVWIVKLGEQLAKRYKLDLAPQPQGSFPIYDEALWVPPVPASDAAGAPAPPAGGEKSIVVSIDRQQLWAYEGDTVVLSTLTSTGRPGFDTPTGLFYINTKLESEDMEGVLGGEYYNVPAVPWVMYFTDVGHAIHGAYWHNNFGEVMSHGCVNLPMDTSNWLYSWAQIGTPVLIVS